MTGFIPWKTVDLRLQAAQTIWLCTTRPDGRPHAIPIWFIWDGRHIFFTAAKHSQKAQNLAHQGWVVLHLDDSQDTVLLTGQATIVIDTETLQRLDLVYREKYVDPLTGSPATALNPEDYVYRVPITSVTAWYGGNSATRTDWRFES